LGITLSESPGCSAGKGPHDCIGSTGSALSVEMSADLGSVSLFPVTESVVAEMSSGLYALNARGRRGVGAFSAYTHSRWTLSQFLQFG
jgi:hypothetical protein